MDKVQELIAMHEDNAEFWLALAAKYERMGPAFEMLAKRLLSDALQAERNAEQYKAGL